MKIAFNWLLDYIALPSTASEVSEMLTGCGLEVEALEEYQPVKGGLAGLIVGEVLDKVKHPNADKLSITRVETGDGVPKQIVCGASNVERGQKVIVAPVGTRLFPVSGEPFEIKKSKIRGEVSEGMICAEDEIGLGTAHDGIIVLPPDTLVGMKAADYYNIRNDQVFEIGLTPNRADATSHFGVARDLAAVWNAGRLLDNRPELPVLSVHRPPVDAFKGTGPCGIQIQVDDSSACPRYAGVVISGVHVSESPSWLKDRLLSVGIKPINVIVDVTNFVMLETGQPLHAFDTAAIDGNGIRVQKLAAGTSFVTLDGTERKLEGTELMICDSQRGLCMAGIYGGLDSGISDQTKTIFLESACFNPTLIRKASKLHGLKTDASFRFERGSDPDMVIYAIKRAAMLIAELMPGTSCSAIEECYPHPIRHAAVTLSTDKLNEVAGMTLNPDAVKEIIRSLEIRLVGEAGSDLQLEVPPCKPDVNRPTDVIEEIMRIYGYNRILVPSKMNSNLPRFFKPDRLENQNRISRYLASQGFYEMMGNSLGSSDYAGMPGLPGEAVRLLNPLSNDLAVLRQTMLFSGLQAIRYNINRKNADLRLFESGKIYFRDEGTYKEEFHLQLLVTGKRHKPNWVKETGDYSIFYLRSLFINLLTVSGFQKENDVEFREETRDPFAVFLGCYFKNRPLGSFGMLKKRILRDFDIDQDVFTIQVALDNLLHVCNQGDIQVTEIPRFPEVKRDLSMVLDRHVTYESVERTARETERKLLKRVQLFDVYQGDKMEAGKKSIAVSFILGDDQKTLEEKQIDAIMNKLMANFERKLGAVIRKGAG